MSALYFDLDGTLVNSAQCSVVTAQATFLKFCGMHLEDSKIIEKMGIPIEVSFPALSDNLINDTNWNEVATYFRNEYRKNSDTHTFLYEGISDFLKNIAAQNDNIFVVTSKKTAAAENNLVTLGIRPYFREIIGSDKVEHYKPHPDPVYKARQHLSGTDHAELMIGDADTDIIMGQAAGIKTCAVTWGAHDRQRLMAAKPDYIVDTVHDLHELILSFR